VTVPTPDRQPRGQTGSDTATGGAGGCGILIGSRMPLMTAGVRAWIDSAAPGLRVVGTASTPGELRAGWRLHRPDMVVLVNDTQAPSLLTVIRQEAGDAAVLVLTGRCEVRHEVALVRAGASGVLDTCCRPDEFLGAVDLVRRGRAAVSAAAVQTLAVANSCELLTSRQQEILDLLKDGVRPREIAERLVISPNTVKTHMLRMRRRLADESALPSLNGHRDGWHPPRPPEVLTDPVG
jgi:DNA-binding NarL/FixJ family response regulator